MFACNRGMTIIIFKNRMCLKNNYIYKLLGCIKTTKNSSSVLRLDYDLRIIKTGSRQKEHYLEYVNAFNPTVAALASSSGSYGLIA